MNKNKTLVSLIVSMLFLSIGAAFPPALAQAQAVVKIEPAWNEFGNSAGSPIPLPTPFTITCKIYNVTDLYGFGIQINWSTTYLSYVSHTVTVPVNGTPPYPGGILWKPVTLTADTVHASEGWYDCAYSELGAETPTFNGSGTVFTMTFNVIKQPYMYETGDPALVDPVDTLIDFRLHDLSDKEAKAIPNTVEPATVRIWEKLWSPPPIPVLKVLPTPIKDKALCTNFSVEIWITGVDPYYDIAGFDIIGVNFDPTLIEAVDITEGPYLKSYVNVSGGGGTFEVMKEINNTAGTVRYALVQLPPRLPPPPASGILFTITFHAIYESTTYPTPSCPITIGPSELALFPHPEIPTYPYLGRPYAVPLDHNTEPGLYISKWKPVGRVIDLYVCDFPEPFKGTGPNVPCEAYPPQKVVHLKANVTYNGWPVQYKLVTFEIHDPLDRVVAVRTAFTDDVGVARVDYRLMWPCENYSEMFGIWKVVATVDIYCTVKTDTMQFKVWWPLEIVGIYNWYAPSYKIGQHMGFKVVLKTCFVWTYNAVIVVTAYDDVGQPIGNKIVTLTYGMNNMSKWCEWEYYEVIVACIEVPKWAAVGEGTAYAVALRDMPWNGGDALSPEKSVKYGIEMP